MGLVLENIYHRYGETIAVTDAAFSAETGEITCLFGPSGCGKTTLLRLAAGLEQVQSGRIELDGTLLSDPETHIAAEKRSIGFVFQDYVLFPHLTIAENVGFGVSHMPRKQRRALIASELEAVDLEAFSARYPHELSGGQQQRVALARAFARRPRAMLLDEPFASIDAVRRRRLRDDVRAILKGHQAATILVTHDPEEALALGDKIVIMKEGRIVETATPEVLFKNPQTPEGAAIFPGAQTIAAVLQEGYLHTAFGDIQTPSSGSQSMTVVIRDGAAVVRRSADGPAHVLDSQFSGPDWRIRLGSSSSNEILSARADAPIASGAKVAVDFDPSSIHIYPAEG